MSWFSKKTLDWSNAITIITLILMFVGILIAIVQLRSVKNEIKEVGGSIEKLYLNNRDDNNIWMSPYNLVETYLDLYNKHQYVSACSLLKKTKCDSDNVVSLNNFSREWEKLLNGYEDIELYEIKKDNFSSIVCVKYKYYYKMWSVLLQR